MAFMSRAGSLLRLNTKNHIINSGASSSSSLLQAVRYMSSSKIFIGGLSYSTDDMSLKEAFSSYGEVVETKVILDRETGRSRGFAFVSFTSSEEAANAVQAMDGQDLHGRRIRVNYATDRVGGFRQGGYGNTGYGGGYGGGGAYGGNTGGGYGGGDGGGGAYGGNTGGGYGGGAGGGGAYGGNTGGGYGANYNSTVNVADGNNNFMGGQGELDSSGHEFNIRDSMGAGEFGQDTPVEETNK